MFVVLLSVLTGAGAYAAKKQKADVTLVSARKTPPAEGHKRPGTELVIVWNSATYPESFFWRGENGWLPCSVKKAHGIRSGKKTVYNTKDITNDQVHKGDMLMLVPTPGGKFETPAEIPAMATNTLYYKIAGGTKWLSLKVSKIAEK